MRIPYFDSRDLDYNPLINSNFDFWQRSQSTLLTTVEAKVSDKHYSGTVGPTAKSVTVARSTDVPTGRPIPARYSSQLTNNTGVPSFAVNDYLYPLWHQIEGTIWRPVAGDKFTLGFWMFASVAGTYAVAIRRNAGARYYVTTVAASAGVWQYHVVYVPLDTSGPAQVIDETRALDVVIGGIGGTNSQAPTLNVWANGALFTHASATNWASTVGAVIRISQMGIKKGFRSLEDMRDGYKPYSQNHNGELAACQRYFEKSYVQEQPLGALVTSGTISAHSNSSGTLNLHPTISYKVTKRVSPTLTFYSPATGTSGVWRDTTTASDRAVVSIYSGDAYAILSVASVPAGSLVHGHYAADADF